MLNKSRAIVMREEISQAQDILRKLFLEREDCWSFEDRTILWNAVSHSENLLSILENMQSDLVRSLELLDAEGVWTGMDDLLHDRIQHLILERDGFKKLSAGAQS